MSTVHVENTVRDFDAWKAQFDTYEDFRAEQGVESYRVSRGVAERNDVIIDLDFADEAGARAFLPKLAQIMSGPEAQLHLVSHRPPQIYTVVTDRAVAPDNAG